MPKPIEAKLLADAKFKCSHCDEILIDWVNWNPSKEDLEEALYRFELHSCQE